MAASKHPPARWVEYDSVEAMKLLDANTANRALRQTIVDRYRVDMIAGDWRENGDTIKVATDGTLVDGQHRLEAIKQAGAALRKPIAILTVTELDRAAVMPVTDTGLKRLPSDALQLAGYKNPLALAAMIRQVIRMQTGRAFKRTAGVSNSEMLHWLEKNKAAPDWVNEWNWTIRKSNAQPAPAFAACWLMSRVDTFRSAEFMHSLATLEGLGKGSPIAYLATTITKLRVSRTRVEPLQWSALFLQAFNAFQADQTIDRLTVHHSWTPDSFPWPLTREQALAAAEGRALNREVSKDLEQDALPVS